MKNHYLLLVFSLFLSPFYAQNKTDTIRSKKLNEDRIISISLPSSYGKEKNKKYPLLLVLDGDYLFEPFAGAIKFGNYWDDLPEVIVVGINQSLPFDRELESDVDAENGLPLEKGAQFYDFIAMELIPLLEKKYAVAPFKIIAGHDVTAGYMNLFLYKEVPLFDAYISMSPELGKNMETRIPERLSVIKKPLFFYQSTADGDLKKMRERIKLLDIKIKTVINSNLYYQFDDFKNASHYSLVLFSIPNALYHVFGAYQPISNTEFQQKIVTLEKDYVSYLIQKYTVIEQSYGIKMPIRINDFKAIEAAILKNNAFDEFEQLAALAKKSYPRSMLSYYHMGLFYEKTGDNKKASKAYTNGYIMDPIGSLTKDFMLEKADQMKY
jgi:predicted alpha/beta superfamily hydrolase